MPAKLNVGLAYTVSDDNGGSQSASVSLEVELEATLAMEPATIHECVRQFLTSIRQAVTDELNASRHGKGPPRTAEKASVDASAPNIALWLATSKQIKAIYTIAEERGLEMRAVLNDFCSVQRLEELTIEQAGKLINALTSTEP